MALLNPVDQAQAFAPPAPTRVNWRLLVALGATLGFWVAVGEAVARWI